MLSYSKFIKENNEEKFPLEFFVYGLLPKLSLEELIKEISNKEKYDNNDLNTNRKFSAIYTKKLYQIEQKLFKYTSRIYSELSKEIFNFLTSFVSNTTWFEGRNNKDFIRMSYSKKIEYMKGISYYYKKIYKELGEGGFPKESSFSEEVKSIVLSSLDYNDEKEVDISENHERVEVSFITEINSLIKLGQCCDDLISLEGRLKDNSNIELFNFEIQEFKLEDKYANFRLFFK